MKKIMIKTGEYTNKDGVVKGNWKQIGIIKSNNNGEYVMLDPTVNLAGFDRQGKDMLIASIFEDAKQPAQRQEQVSEEDLEDLPF